MTEPNEDSQVSSSDFLIYQLKEKVKKLTNDLFGIEVIFTNDYIANIILPNGILEIKLFYNIKFEKIGYIKYTIENNKLIKQEFSVNNVEMEKLVDRVKEMFDGKIQIFSLKELNEKMEKVIKNGNIYMNYDYLTNSLEYTFIFTDKLGENFEYNEGVTYKFSFNNIHLDEEIMLIKNVAIVVGEFAGNIILDQLIPPYIKELIQSFQNLKDNSFDIFALFTALIAIICIIIFIITGFPVPILSLS